MSIYGQVESARIDMYSSGYSPANTNMTLHTLNKVSANSNIDLFQAAFDTSNNNAKLYINGYGHSLNSTIALTTYSGSSGWYGNHNSLSMYINADNNAALNDFLYMYIKNTQPHVTFNDNSYLFIKGTGHKTTNSIPLTVAHLGTSSQTTLFVKGLGQYPNYIPYNDSCFLYINRPNDVAIIPLFCKTADAAPNSYIPLKTLGGYHINSYITLTASDIVTAKPNSTISLYMQGVINNDGSITLAMPNTTGNPNSNISLVCYHGGGSPNSTIPVYTFGANIDNRMLTLAMPNVYGDLSSGKLCNLFTSGY
jgi:hypothetical protein